MLVLLPPSEGKATPPPRGAALDPNTLSFPELARARSRVVDALTRLCGRDRRRAATVLGLGPTQGDAVDLDARVTTSPTMAARRLYTGVLFRALGLPDLPPPAAARASRDVVIASGLWGLLRPGDRVPVYRLSGAVNLPGTGPLAGFWRVPLGSVLPGLVGRGPLLDLRSGTYRAAWPATGTAAELAVTVRVAIERSGRRVVVSEASKAVRGRLARALLTDPGRAPSTVERLVEAVTRLGEHPAEPGGGWRTEVPARRPARPLELTVVVDGPAGGR